VATDGSGWYGLLNILTYCRETREQYRQQHPVACPNDGTPLRVGPDDSIYCPFDGWRWDGTEDGAYPPVRR
jgi:hypothetical protein